jgi:hypothetical protein
MGTLTWAAAKGTAIRATAITLSQIRIVIPSHRYFRHRF